MFDWMLSNGFSNPFLAKRSLHTNVCLCEGDYGNVSTDRWWKALLTLH